jgi:hypothetical protein
VGLEQYSLRKSAPQIFPGEKLEPTLQAQRDSWTINICDDKHAPVCVKLMKHARVVGGRWMRNYFLKEGKGVYTSSPEFQMELLEKWEIHPCDKEALE